MTISAMKSKTVEVEAPRHLETATQIWFLSVVSDYDLQPHHILLLTAAGECWDRMQAAREAVRKHGLTMNDPKTGAVKARPEVNIERDAKIVFMKLLRDLNLSETPPDSRPPPLKYGAR
jgi:phage terminase small subunit